MGELAREHPMEYPKGTPPLPDNEIANLIGDVPGWEAADGSLRRTFRFKNFVEAFGFLTSVALLAEAEGHHPDMFVSWNQVDRSRG